MRWCEWSTQQSPDAWKWPRVGGASGSNREEEAAGFIIIVIINIIITEEIFIICIQIYVISFDFPSELQICVCVCVTGHTEFFSCMFNEYHKFKSSKLNSLYLTFHTCLTLSFPLFSKWYFLPSHSSEQSPWLLYFPHPTYPTLPQIPLSRSSESTQNPTSLTTWAACTLVQVTAFLPGFLQWPPPQASCSCPYPVMMYSLQGGQRTAFTTEVESLLCPLASTGALSRHFTIWSSTHCESLTSSPAYQDLFPLIKPKYAPSSFFEYVRWTSAWGFCTGYSSLYLKTIFPKTSTCLTL